MSQLPVVIVVVVAVFAAWILGAWLRGGSTPAVTAQGQENANEPLGEEVHRLLATQAQGIAAQMAQFGQVVTQQLTEVRHELSKAAASPDKNPADTNQQLTAELRTSNNTLARVTERLDALERSGHDLSQATQALQTVLANPRTRGSLGEAALENLLADCLPRGSYDLQRHFSNGCIADAVLHTGKKLIAIDAKFPLDTFRRLQENAEGARPAFAQAVRNHVDAVAGQFIVPDEGTLDLALMLVPSESAFYEILVTADDTGRLDDYCRAKNVLPVSPNSLHAYLRTILVGLKGIEFEENARQMLASVRGLRKEIDDFAEVHLKLGRQIQNARLTYDDASRRFERARHSLAETAESLAGNAAAETEPPEAEEAAALAPAVTSNNGS